MKKTYSVQIKCFAMKFSLLSNDVATPSQTEPLVALDDLQLIFN